jgi:WD40 repeat protein
MRPSVDGVATIWDATTGPDARILRGQKENCSDIAYSPDGSRVAATFFGGPLKVWNAQTGEEILTIQRPNGGRGVEFSPDGKSLISGGNILDAQTGQEIPTAMPIRTYSPDGKLVASDGKVLDAQNGKALFSIGEHAGGRNMIFSPDGKTVVTACVDGKARVWDAQSGAKLLVLRGHVNTVQCVSLSPDGRRSGPRSGFRGSRAWAGLTLP